MAFSAISSTELRPSDAVVWQCRSPRRSPTSISRGSRYQDQGWLASIGARFAVVSVGADNDYGHPATETLDSLTATGTEVLRTDRDGDVVIAAREFGIPTVVQVPGITGALHEGDRARVDEFAAELRRITRELSERGFDHPLGMPL